MASLVDWLRQRGDDELLSLLRARPDLATPPPADSSVLATRVGVRSSVIRACEDLDAFALSTLEALVVLDADQEPVTLDALTEMLGSAVTHQRVRRTVDELRARALIWGEDEELSLVPAVREAMPHYPGGLGSPAENLSRQRAVEVLAELDTEERRLVDRLAEGSPVGQTKDAGTRVSADTARTPVQRLLARGLLIRRDTATVELPRQLALAVRGDQPMGPVRPEEPAPELSEHGQARVDSTAAGEVLELVRHTEALLDAWGADPPDVLRSGGIGVRELRRTSKALEISEQRLALIVELAVAAGLLATSDDADPQWLPTLHADSWLATGPENRWAELAHAWLDLPRLPGLTGGRDDRDRLLGPLAEELRRPSAPRERRRVLGLLAELPSGYGVREEDATAVLAWRAPRRGGRLRDDLVRWTLGEARALGIVALGALSTAGAALLDDGPGAAAKVLAEALPEPLDHVLVQADFTVVAPGRLEPELANDMNLIADVESAGGATVYRISESSVRRALDAGRTPEDLHTLLRTRSKTPIPQSLSYLIDDVARRHGLLRAGSASAFVRCEDPVLLEEVLANPKTHELELRKIAPTVLISPLPLAELVEGLRAAGLAPVAEGPDGQVVDLRPGRRRVRGRSRASQPVRQPTAADPDQLAELITKIRAGDRARSARRGSALRPEHGRPSAEATLALLRDAAKRERDVWLGFVDSNGVASQRIVRPTGVGGGILRGVDQGRDEPGDFPLHRITSVAMVEED